MPGNLHPSERPHDWECCKATYKDHAVWHNGPYIGRYMKNRADKIVCESKACEHECCQECPKVGLEHYEREKKEREKQAQQERDRREQRRRQQQQQAHQPENHPQQHHY